MPETIINTCDIRLDDLPPEYREIAEEIGLDAAIALSRIRGTEAVFVPKLESLCRRARNRAIREEAAAGVSARELGRKYNLSAVWIRAIAAGQDDYGEAEPVDNQRSLF